MIAIPIAITALLFSISGFVLGLLGLIQARASAQSTHTVMQPEATQDLSKFFGLPEQPEQEDLSIPTDELESTLLKGFE